MLQLIRLGYVTEKSIYQDACNVRVAKKSKKEETKESESETRSLNTQSTKTSQNASRVTSRKQSENEETNKEKVYMDMVEESDEKKKAIKKALKKLTNIKDNPNFQITDMNSSMVRGIRDTIQEIWESVNSLKCPHCGIKPSNIKLDSYTKFIIETKSDKEKIGKVLHTKKGYESDEEETEEDREKEKERREFEKMTGIKSKEVQQIYINPLEVKEHVRILWANHGKILNLIFGNLVVNQNTLEKLRKGYKILCNGHEMFFLEVVPVTPNRFRPENKMNDQTFLHEHTVLYSKILQTNADIKKLLTTHKTPENQRKKSQDSTMKSEDEEHKEEIYNSERTELTDTIRLWIQLQDSVNCLIDASKALKINEREASGIRQLLERKEGLFRMKMMGKRVNYAARSVISPDPYIDTNEVGVPMYVAKTLTFPESVNEYNIERLRKCILNGAQKWPGANYLEENGVKIALDTRNESQRQALAKTLMYNYRNKVVYRHLMSGDVMLFNRQPTLHKASIMSHIARVLPKENTIRNHYANCSTYNADFDGDEMNLHLLQNHLARAEAYTISNTANQYISPTHGKPLRGLIQDSIVSGFFLTIRGNFLEKEEYQQLVYSAVWNVISSRKKAKIVLLPPAIWKPKKLWTGKQVISSVIKTIVVSYNPELNEDNLGLNMSCKARVKLEDFTKRKIHDEGSNSWKTVIDEVAAEESLVVIRDNELIQGVIDKNQIGNSEGGLIHSFYELYGGQITETLLTCIARLLVVYLQYHGETCGIDDLKMSPEYEEQRREKANDALKEGIYAAAQFAGYDKEKLPKTIEQMNINNRSTFRFKEGKYSAKVHKRKPDVDYISAENPLIKVLQRKLIFEKNGYKEYDVAITSKMGRQTSSINSELLPNGLQKKFPKNFFSVIVATGAKGSNVNQTQVSSMLGQQELEGRRVPVLPSGKTLPSFLPYDPNPRAWGYITDRFISGVRPQDFYFHCMAGREGLIDTAVKTSVSGYLQRCLMKNMETLIVNYDFTVRDQSESSIIQFYYGEDALDTTKIKYLKNFEFVEKNHRGYIEKYNPKALKEKVASKEVKSYLKERKAREETFKSQLKPIDPTEEKSKPDQFSETIMERFFPGSHLGAISEDMLKSIEKFIKDYKFTDESMNKKKFKTLAFVKYFYSLMHPGECVGALAAQAIGEPSTQMTLNTFHLAGHGGANVTLGIPRLREILFKGPRKVKTPMMTLTIRQAGDSVITREQAEQIKRQFQKLKLKELVSSLEVREIRNLVKDGRVLSESERSRVYNIAIKLEDTYAIEYAFGLKVKKIKDKIKNIFMYHLMSKIGKEIKKSKHSGADFMTQKVKDSDEKRAVAEDAAEESGDEGEEEPAEDKRKKGKKQQKEDVDEAKLAQYSQYFDKLLYEEDGNHLIIRIFVKVPLDSKKLLMINIVESVISEVCISEVPGISNCHLSSEKAEREVNGKKENVEVFKITTEGVNFPAVWNSDFFEKNTIKCNDISEINSIYGIEACRRGIIQEIITVFKPYGITVDYRHISLIADFITFNGRIRPLTREGIKDSVSPLQKMSFEMASRFLSEAALNNEIDSLRTASAQIVLGRAPTIGTGMFDVMHKIEEREQHSSDGEMDQE